MKWGAWIWGLACLALVIGSAAGWLIRVSPVLLSVPPGLFAIGAAGFCIGRPARVTAGTILACVFAGALAVLAATHLPLRAGFAGSKKALDSLATEAAAGNFKPDARAGCYQVKAFQVEADGSVYLWTTVGEGGRSGFVRSPQPEIPGAIREVDFTKGWSYVYMPGKRF